MFISEACEARISWWYEVTDVDGEHVLQELVKS